MNYTFNSTLVWMNIIFISGFCGFIDFIVLVFKQFFMKRIYNMVKPLKKDDISYEYIKTMPQELQDLLLAIGYEPSFIINSIKKEYELTI